MVGGVGFMAVGYLVAAAGSEAMASREPQNLDPFIEKKRRILEGHGGVLSQMLASAPASKAAALNRLAEKALAFIQELDGMTDALLALKADEVAADVTPRFCERCRHILTHSTAQLNRHIEERADQMMQLSGFWPREHFVRRMHEELSPGDEIIFLGIGRATVLRKNGSHEVIYREKH
jgi:hypothetical protein